MSNDPSSVPEMKTPLHHLIGIYICELDFFFLIPWLLKEQLGAIFPKGQSRFNR